MRHVGDDTRGAMILQRLRGLRQRAGGVDQVIERLLVMNPALVSTYPKLGRSLRRRNPLHRSASLPRDSVKLAGEFVREWGRLESTAAQRLTGEPAVSFPIGPKRLEQLGLDDTHRDKLISAQQCYRTLARRPGRLNLQQLERAVADVRAVIAALSSEPSQPA